MSARVALWALALAVFAIPWQEAVVVGGVGSVARLSGLAAVLVGLVSVLHEGRLRLRPLSLLLWTTTAYVVWLAMSYFWTIDVAASREGLLTAFQLLLLVWLIWQICRGRYQRNLIAQLFVLGSYVVVVNILWVFLFSPEQIRVDGRIASQGANQNEVATVVALAMAIAWWLVTQRRGLLSGVTNGLFLLLGPMAVLLTGSRSGTLVALLALLAIPLSLRGVRRGVRAAVLILAAGSVVGLSLLPSELYQRALPNLERIGGLPGQLTDSDFTGRTEIWAGGFKALVAQPVVGYGNNSFRRAVMPILGNGWAPHNTILSVGVGTGLIGLMLFGLALSAAFLPQLALPASPERTTRIVLFLCLLLSMLPKSGDFDKSTWFVLALLTADVGPILVERVRAPFLAGRA